MKPALKRTILKIFFPAVAALFVVLSADVGFAGRHIKVLSADPSGFPTVLLKVAVSNGGRGGLTNLTDENIRVYEDGFRVNYVSVKCVENDRQARIVLALDSSRSIKGADLEQIKKAARSLVEASQPGDSFAVVRFNDEVSLNCPLTSDRDRLARCIDAVSAHGSQTRLYSAVYESIDLLGDETGGPKAVIVFTDGKDEGSSLKSDDVIALSVKNSVPVYAVMVKPGAESRRFERLARLSGGSQLRCCNQNALKSLYGAIKSGGTSLYEVRYRSMASADGLARPVEVRLHYDSLRDRDSLDVKYRRGIFGLDLPSTPQILLIVLLLLIIALLAACTILLFRRGASELRRTATEPTAPVSAFKKHAPWDFAAALQRDEKARAGRDRLIGPQDPEYIYAKAWLVQKDGPEAGKKFPIYWEDISIGRDGENGIIVKDDSVSLKHARIKEMKGAYYLFDLASDNGTYLNGRKLLRPKPLYDWDEIGLGRTLFIFRGSKIS